MVDDAGQRVYHAAGMVTPDAMRVPAVSNNHTELLALVRGLDYLPDDFTGTVYSDSAVSLQRVFEAARLHNVPAWLVADLQRIQKSGRLARMRYALLDGHPTRAHLAAGIGKRGHVVSEHNVWCDAQCTAIARQVQS